jgi:biopolymer transport protein ExbD
MAGVDVGGSGRGSRPRTSDINMIPFIDLLMVMIAFLLITAVWTTSSRIDAGAQVPSREGCGEDCAKETERSLHVHVAERELRLEWRRGATVESSVSLPRPAVATADEARGVVRYPELANRIEAEWAREGAHRDPGDPRLDRAVLHTDDHLPFREIVAVLDALHAPTRDVRVGGELRRTAAFQVAFASR